MERQLGKEYSKEEREQFLRDNCDGVAEKGYMKRFSAEEIMEKKEELSETDILLNDLEDEKKEVMREFKERIDPVAERRRSLLRDIKQKAEYVTEKCYKFVDEEERMTGFYNGAGELIEQRPAGVDEMQKTIFSIGRKTGTNDK